MTESRDNGRNNGKSDEQIINGSKDCISLHRRQRKYYFLPEDRSKRIIITGSQSNIRGFTICRKPFSGMFALYENIKKTETHKEKINNEEQYSPEESISIKRLNYFAQKNTKNVNGQITNNKEASKSHSATNKIIALGEILLERARKISQKADTCPEAVYAATLALEGKELLYGRTMTCLLYTSDAADE